MGLSVDWAYLRKESLRLRIYQLKLPKLKSKENKDWKPKQNKTKNRAEYPRTVEDYKKCNIV